MKLLIPLLLISSVAFGQPYLSLGISHKGVNTGLGMLAGSIDLAVNYEHPMSRVDKPAILYFTIGKQFLLDDNEEDNWSITPFAGYANCTYKDLSLYESEDKIIKVSEFKPMYGVEIGKDAHLGRISFVVKRCESMYYGFVMKVFFYR